MKISEAIKIGMQGKKQCRDRYWDKPHKNPDTIQACCALGAAYLGWCKEKGEPFMVAGMGPIVTRFVGG